MTKYNAVKLLQAELEAVKKQPESLSRTRTIRLLLKDIFEYQKRRVKDKTWKPPEITPRSTS